MAYGRLKKKPSIKKDYTLNVDIRNFYGSKGSPVSDLDGLYINIIGSLMHNRESSKFGELCKILSEADPKRYPKRDKNRLKNKVSVHLAEMKKKRLLIRDKNDNWLLKYYDGISKYL